MQGSPGCHVNHMKTEPTFNKVPNPDGVPTLEKKMCSTFLRTLAKWTESTILPTPLGESVGRPNPITGCKPRKEFHLWWSPNAPNVVVEGGDRRSNKLCAVSRCRRIMPTRRVLPNHVVNYIFAELGVSNLLPKLNKLPKVLHGENHIES